MKYKVDHYRVPGKKRVFDVLVFPVPDVAWAYDDYPEEPGPRIDGDSAAYKIYAVALAALAADPSKIIFFPLKKEQHPMGFGQTYHLALMRSDLQFRRSEWPRLHKNLNRRHWVGKYTVRYDQKKLMDYCQRFREPLHPRVQYKRDALYVEEIRGDTVFFVLPKEFCYDIHRDIIYTLEDLNEENEYSAMTRIGWILTKRVIRKFNDNAPPLPNKQI